jgi:hypothetical protein
MQSVLKYWGRGEGNRIDPLQDNQVVNLETYRKEKDLGKPVNAEGHSMKLHHT